MTHIAKLFPRPPSDGQQSRIYEYLGAHPCEFDGTPGTWFAVWAPNAREVHVLCDRSHWQGGLRLHSSDAGIWYGFVPHIGRGAPYKYGIVGASGEWLVKSDPVAFAYEPPPQSASLVWDFSAFEWHDADWMARRRASNPLQQPFSMYEVHAASWKRPHDGRAYHNYRELAHLLVEYLQETQFTHVELLPITEHPFGGSWGYQCTGYFAPTHRYGTPDDFQYFVDYLHQHGFGVILDWVPAHFPDDPHALARFDGTHLYEHADPRRGYHPDWNTLIFNYGRNEVRDFLLSSARFWLEVYHIDGLRVDAVASMLYLDYSRKDSEWVPNPYGGRENLEAIQFLQDCNRMLHADYPGAVTIAEESTAWPGVSRPVYTGGLGFTMKWDMGWMNDTLRYFRRDPTYRKYHHNELTFRQMYAYSENFVLPLSHDEVVHGKRSLLEQMPGDVWQKFANLRLLYGYQFTVPGKQLLFMGNEIGQWREWNHDAEIDWYLLQEPLHSGLKRFVTDLNRLYRQRPALFQRDFDPDGFHWIDCNDAERSLLAFFRTAERQPPLVVIANFTPTSHDAVRFGVPVEGVYRELINSDSELYGGSNWGNAGGVTSEPVPSHGLPHSIQVRVPPLGLLIFEP